MLGPIVGILSITAIYQGMRMNLGSLREQVSKKADKELITVELNFIKQQLQEIKDKLG